MKVDKFSEALRMTPVYVATFKVTRVPKWAKGCGVTKGETVFGFYDGLYREVGGGIALQASHVTFTGYKLYKGAKP